MKLQIDTDKNVVSSVTEKTGVIDAVASATRVFLGTAIGLGFVASAMGFFLLPGLQTKTPTIVKNLPLQVIDVVRAVSTRDASEIGLLLTQRYYAGTTLVYEQTQPDSPADTTYRTARRNESLAIFFDDQAVNTNASTGFSNQYINLSYRQVGDLKDRLMTLCLGQTSSLEVYVGSDGSTYTDAKLTRRTTTTPCATILSRALKINDVASAKLMPHPNYLMFENEMISAWDNINLALSRTNALLGRKTPGAYSMTPEGTDRSFQDGQAITGGDDPLLVYHEDGGIVNSMPPTKYTRTIEVPESILEVSAMTGTTSQVHKLCVPAANFVAGQSNDHFYFDREGTPYLDLFLSNRATGSTCSSILARAFAPTRLRSATWSQNMGPDHGVWIQGAFWHYGVMHQATWYDRQDTNDLVEGETMDEMGTAILAIGLGNECTLSVATCTATRPGIGTGPTLEVARQYARSFCFGKVACTGNPLHTCYDSGDNPNPMNVNYGSYVEESNSENQGVFTSTGRCETNQPYTVATPIPFNLPSTTLYLTDDQGVTVNACFQGDPEARMSLLKYMYFYDRQGQPYRDLFLSQPVDCDAPTTPPIKPPPVPLPLGEPLSTPPEIYSIE